MSSNRIAIKMAVPLYIRKADDQSVLTGRDIDSGPVAGFLYSKQNIRVFRVAVIKITGSNKRDFVHLCLGMQSKGSQKEKFFGKSWRNRSKVIANAGNSLWSPDSKVGIDCIVMKGFYSVSASVPLVVVTCEDSCIEESISRIE